MTIAGSETPQKDATQSLTEHLWERVQALPVAQADLGRAVLHLLDWVGYALAGGVTPTGRAVVGDAGMAGVTQAGALGSIFEMDDVHRTALVHSGPVVVPAVLVAGPASGVVALRAVLAGYQAMIALGRAVGPGQYAQFHNTGTCGAIEAAAGASLALGLTDAQGVGAMGTALSLTGGLWQCRNEPVATKHLHVAEAARRGLIAAQHAGAGLPGPRFILEGPQGFFAGMARDGWPLRMLHGHDAWLAHQVSFKPWPACRHSHPAIDAALSLRAVLGDDAVAGVAVATYADAVTFCDRMQPRTPGHARFFGTACRGRRLQRGPPGLADFDPPAIADPTIAALRMRIAVTADAALTARYPAHFGADVIVTAAAAGC